MTNERYKVIWQILNALRSHDERLEADINKIDFTGHPGDRIEIIPVTDTLPSKRKKREAADLGIGQGGEDQDRGEGDRTAEDASASNEQYSFGFDSYSKAIMAKIVKRCGNRDYWVDWAGSVAKIAEKHITRITVAVGRRRQRGER